MVELSHKLKTLRLKKGLTQGQVAELLGVTASVISAYEIGIRQPSYDKLIKLAYLYNVSTDYLLGVEIQKNLRMDGLTEEEIQALVNLIEVIRRKN